MNRTQSILATLLGRSLWVSCGALARADRVRGHGGRRSRVACPTKLEIEGGDARSSSAARARPAHRRRERYPVDGAKVQKLLEDLKQIEVRRAVVSGSRYHAALRVTDAEHERRLRIFGAAGEEPSVELFVGTSPNYGINHVRRADRDEVYEQGLALGHAARGEPGSRRSGRRAADRVGRSARTGTAPSSFGAAGRRLEARRGRIGPAHGHGRVDGLVSRSRA
jgi:hypothetical protein